MNSSDKSSTEDNDHSDDDCNSSSDGSLPSARQSLDGSSSSEHEYSEWPVMGSDREFGPEGTQHLPKNDKESAFSDELAWVPSFKDRVGDTISRLLNDSLKFCISGKIIAPPIISITLLKAQKCISFPLYEDMLDSIVPSFEQSAFGRGTVTVVDTSFRNSWELAHTDFEIMNTEWSSYLTNVIQPLIQRDLKLEVGFRLSLYKLLLYKSGSFFKPHRDSEKDDGMFGTVVVQLPSFYDGGKLIVRHNHRTEEVDLSSTDTPQNAFSIFYTAFYCDCEHEVLPITKGVRACLVYNLLLTGDIQREIFPSAARLEPEGREEDLVNLLRNSWSNNQKLVYCLSHKYTQKNLSLENLKSSDRLIGRFFQKYADLCGYQVMIGILKRKKYRYAEEIRRPRVVTPRPRREPNHMYWYNIENGYEYLNHNYYDDDDDDYDEIATISDVDSNDQTVCFYDDYKIKYLKSLDKERHIKLPSLDVDFECEVLPENSFHDVKAFHEDQEVTGNEGVQCSKFYQCAALMVYRPDDLLPILVEGDAKLSKIEDTFFNEFKMHKDSICVDGAAKEKCLKWCHVLMDRYLSWRFAKNEMQKTSEIFEMLLMLDDSDVLRKFLNIQKFEHGDFSYVHIMCQRHGWSTFSSDILSKFGKLKPAQGLVSLQKFVEYASTGTHLVEGDKQIIVHSILKEMLVKFDSELKTLKKDQQVDRTKSFLISLWPIASKVNFLHLAEYAKTKPMKIVVPVLISVAQHRENISNQLWLDVAKHFKSKMELVRQTPIEPTFTWKQNVNLSCNCKHCQFVENFLKRPFQQKLDFFGKKPIRDHVQQILAGVENLSFSTLASGVLRINKPRKTGEIQSAEYNFVTSNLSKLCTLISSTYTISVDFNIK